MSDNHRKLQHVQGFLAAINERKKDRYVDADLVRVLTDVVVSQQETITSMQIDLVLMREQLRHLGIR